MLEVMPSATPEENKRGKILESKSQFEKAGFKTGDRVSYKIDTASVSELKLVSPNLDHPQGGALLMKEAASDHKKIPDDFLTDPGECEIHSYPSRVRALEAYPGLLTQVKSLVDLFKVFKVLERSGIDPNDPEINLNNNPEIVLSWNDAQAVFNATIKNYRSGDVSILKQVTRKHGLRDKIREIAEAEKGDREKSVEEMLNSLKYSDSVYIGDLDIIKIRGSFMQIIGESRTGKIDTRNYSLEEVKQMILAADPKLIRIETSEQSQEKEKRNRESLVERARNMQEGEIVEIQGVDYIKLKSDTFQIYGNNFDEAGTVVVHFYKFSEIENLILKSSPSKVKFKIKPDKKESKNKNIDEADLEELKNILPELYPKAYRHFGNLTGGHPIYEEVLKYLPKSEIRQGKIGDCYLLAAINSLKKAHPNLYLYILSKSIKKGVVPDTWRVKFRGLDHAEKEDNKAFDTQGWIHLTKLKLDEWSEKGVRADLPDMILERAYASYISQKKSGDEGNSDRINSLGMLDIEGGFGHRALLDLIGSSASMKRRIGDMGHSLKESNNENNVRHFLLGLFTTHPEKYVVTANIHYQGSVDHKWVGGYLLYSRHAYSLLKVKHDRVYLNDPHDTSVEIVLDIKDFVSNFGQLSYVELK